jgi:membrane protein DedA with SNARE-associated domain
LAAPPLPGPLAHLAPLLDDYGYAAVGLLVLLDNCGIPVPGQTILVLAAVYAGTGRMSIAAVVVIGVLAAVVGNTLGYLIGRTGGHAFVHRWGRYVALTPARMARAEGFFDRNGPKVVTVARFIDGLRQTNGIIAGTSEMAWRRFQPANILGALLWVGAWATAGYLTGSDIGPLYERVLRYQVYLLAALGVVVVALVVRAVLHRRRGKRPPEGGPGAGAGATGDGGTPADGEGPVDGEGRAADPAGTAPGPQPPDQRSGTTSNEDA